VASRPTPVAGVPLIFVAAGATVLGVVEDVDDLVRLVGVDEEKAVLDLAKGPCSTWRSPAWPTRSRWTPTCPTVAGRPRPGHYHRRDWAISLADCVAAEVARRDDDRPRP
jgi:hypothetical protein